MLKIFEFYVLLLSIVGTKHPAKLFCLILPNKGIMAISVIFEISKELFSVI
jgi:hypothetical protein